MISYDNTLDLVLSYGLPVLNLEICKAFFSDHMYFLRLLCHVTQLKLELLADASTAALFSAAFSQNHVTPDPGCDDSEALSSQFLDTCQIAIDCADPLKSRQRKAINYLHIGF